MSGKIVIVTYDEMLEQYVPAPTTEDGRHLPEPLQELNQLDFKDVPKPLEKDMYTPLATALNQSWLIGEEYVVRSTPNKADSDVRSNEKVDGGVYRAGNVPPADQERTKWSDIELPIECKTHPTSDDPFEDNEEKKGAPEPMSSDRRKVLGQMMSYASLVFENQHRTHVLTLVVLGKMARIVRWDRSGVIASNKFDYVKEPIKLARFIWRFARLTPELRGHDSTAELVHPGSEDYELMEDRAYRPILHPDGSAVADHARRMFAESLQGNAPRWRLRVGGKDDPHYFLVGAPHFSASGLAGRGTRGYVALDAASPDGPFVYLKDAWRVAHDRIQQEGETLQHLNSDDNGGPVTGVPTLLYHGDVDEQVTESQNAWRRKHPQQPTCPLKTHRHYRLVVKEVGLSMSTFRSVRELVGMLAACIEAHRHAYTRKGYLHRDISAGNVLIYPRPTKMPNGTIKELRVGLLTDWELAKNICDTQEGPRQPDRTGTWQFMSASSLLNTSKRIIVQDDMESFFHILLYFAIRFVPHNCQDVAQFMDIYFDGHTHENGVYFGGEKKLNSMRNGLVTTLKGDVLTFFVRHPPRDLRAANAPSLPAGSVEQPAAATGNTVNDDPEGPPLEPSPRVPTKLTVKHPINDILGDLLDRIKAHYTLHVPIEAGKEVDASSLPEAIMTDTSDALLSEGTDALMELKPVSSKQPTLRANARQKVPHGADQETAELAAELGDQEQFGAIFWSYYSMQDIWPRFADIITDQLDPDYRRKNELTTLQGTKRSRIDDDLPSEARSSKQSRSMR